MENFNKSLPLRGGTVRFSRSVTSFFMLRYGKFELGLGKDCPQDGTVLAVLTRPRWRKNVDGNDGRWCCGIGDVR